MRVRAAVLLLSGVLVGAGASADDVYLASGAVFEGVVTEVGGGQVRIRFPMGGGMTLHEAQVLRIEEGESALQQFLRRKELLLARNAAAPEWLALARWARSSDLPGYREIALLVADLDPHLEDLAPLMRGLGFALDDDLGRWIPFDEAMRRRGLVEYEGEWMTLDEQAARIAAQRRATEEAARTEAPPARAVEPEPRERSESGPTGNEVALAQLELFRDVLGTLQRGFPGFVVLGYGSLFDRPDPGGGVHPVYSSGGTLGFKATPGQSKWDAFLHRQPGSMLPLHLEQRSPGPPGPRPSGPSGMTGRGHQP